MTHDVAASCDFYGAVLGWDFEPMGPAQSARYGGKQAAAVVPPFDGATTGWTVYFASDDIAATEQLLVAAGGELLLPHGDVGDAGRVLLALDPTDARFGIWQAGTKAGAEAWGEPGFPCWTDLRSTSPLAAQAFYATALGHQHVPLPEAGPDYVVYTTDGAPLGGVGGMMGAPDGTGSHWLVYLAVASADDAVAAAAAAGGTVMAPPFDTPFGRMAALTDPHGHPFWVTQLPA
jgi:predicted enzyme related to lactoylglutathione lyase